MKKRLQFTEDPIKYYSKLWKVPAEQIKELLKIYALFKDIWQYRHFKKWFKEAYNFQISWKQWKRFKRYCANYNRRKELKLKDTVYVNWEN